MIAAGRIGGRWWAWCFLLAACALACAEDRPNVLFLSVDTLRADHLGCYGYDKPTSPNLDRFAAEGLLFEDTTCEVPLTGPSFGSIMTSRPPRMNGSTRNGLRLPDGVKTVAELFREAGYATFCIQSNWTLKAKLSGIEQGFDNYDDQFHDKRWGIIKPERHGEEVTELALKAFANRDASKPFFGWVHYSDPHAPYKNHPEFNVWNAKLAKLDDTNKVRAKYDSEIAFTDAEIKKLLDALPANTIVVFASDHGESLYEHDYLGHGRRIYQDNMHIAFIVRAPGVQPGRSKAPVRGIDIGPTLLGLAGLKRPETMLGLDVLRDEVPANRVRVFETYGGAVQHVPGLESIMTTHGPLRQGVIAGGWKLIVDGKREELYQLAEDSGELNNLAKSNRTKAAELRALIDAWEKEHPRAEAKEEALTEDDTQALEALGYLK